MQLENACLCLCLVLLPLYNVENRKNRSSQEKIFLKRRRQEDLCRIIAVIMINTYHDSLVNVFALLLGLYGQVDVHGLYWIIFNQEFDEVDERRTNPTLLTPILLDSA